MDPRRKSLVACLQDCGVLALDLSLLRILGSGMLPSLFSRTRPSTTADLLGGAPYMQLPSLNSNELRESLTIIPHTLLVIKRVIIISSK